MIALRAGGWSAIEADWRLAVYALQVMAEETVGRALAEQEAAETVALGRLRRFVH